MQEIKGLGYDEVRQRQTEFGKNVLSGQKKQDFLSKIFHIVKEPMFLLLIIAAAVYLVLGDLTDGFVMLAAVTAIIMIQIIQELRTDRTLNALKELSEPKIKVIRAGSEQVILSSELVPGDVMLVHKGAKVPADGLIIKCSDFCVDESLLTGESEMVWKMTDDAAGTANNQTAELHSYWRKDICYAGTFVIQGSAVIQVDKTGAQTEFGKIGKAVAGNSRPLSPLQKQIGKLVLISGLFAFALFVLVSLITYLNLNYESPTARITNSLLSGIALAMSLIPEEFPVVLVIFLAMGAWRMAKRNSLVRNASAIESLGAVSVLCVDKTGTITMNKMTVKEADGKIENLCRIMSLACETESYDPMEKAMLEYCESQGFIRPDLDKSKLIAEYSFINSLKMMGHVWQSETGEVTVAAKGSPEKILALCNLSTADCEQVENKINDMSTRGLRVIAIASGRLESENKIPQSLAECSLELCGLVGLADPLRESVKENIEACHKAGIRVVMITGDSAATAASIAEKAGILESENSITGDVLENMTDEQLREAVKTTNIFARVIPEQKMRIVKAFKDNGEVVAMTGDGVNDAPALKYADIGIAMGERGSEVSREAADIILTDDNFSTIVHTIEDGRRIYSNIRKAVTYIVAVHIPIALSALFAPLMGIAPALLMLLPIHIALFELIIDPTCSLVLERQHAEPGIMTRKPRRPNESILSMVSLLRSLLQGIVIFIAAFGTYYIALKSDGNAAAARTMGFAIIILANLLLIQAGSSTGTVLSAAAKLFKTATMRFVTVGFFIGLCIMIYTPINEFLKFATLTPSQVLIVIVLSLISVFAFEAVMPKKSNK